MLINLRQKLRRKWLGLLLIGLTAFLCTVTLPSLSDGSSRASSQPNDSAAIETLVQQGKSFYDAGQFTDAVKVLQQAFTTSQQRGDKLKQAMTLSNLSLAYQQLGRWSEANQAIADSFKRLQTEPNLSHTSTYLQVKAQILNTQGRLQLMQGKFQPALTTWQAAVDTYTQAGETIGAIGAEINQAQAMQALGLYRQAVAKLTAVAQPLQAQPDSSLKVLGLRQLGNALRVVGELDRSQQVLQQSLAIAQQLQSTSDISAALLNLGNLARVKHDPTTALSFYQQAAIASPSQITQLQAQLNQLSLLVATEQLNAASELLPKIQSQLATVPLSSKTVYARIDFAQSLMKLGNREWESGSRETRRQGDKETRGQGEKRAEGAEGATTNSQFTIHNSQLSHAPRTTTQLISAKTLRRSLLHHAPLSYQQPTTNYQLPITNYQLPTTKIAQLLATAVNQSRNLGDKRAEAYAVGNLGSLYEQNQQWNDAIKLTEQALLQAEAIAAPDIAYQWQWQLGRLLKVKGDRPGAIAAYTQTVDILKSLRNDLVAIDPNVQFDFRENVEPVYRQFVELLLQPTPSQQNLAQARMAIESLQLAELNNFFRTACLSAQPVPLDRIVDRDNPTAAVIYPIILSNSLEIILKLPQQPNLRHYSIPVSQNQVEATLEQWRKYLEKPYTAPEGKLLSQKIYNWLIQPAQTELTQAKVKTLVFVLDGALRNIPMAALFDGEKYLIQNYSVALAPGLSLLDPQPFAQVASKALVAGLTASRLGFSPLTNVAIELERVEAEIPSIVLRDRAFTSKALRNQMKSRSFSVVHLATHGQFSSNPNETFILAWDKPIRVNELSNLLQSRDPNQRNPIEMLVLSACETAAGDKRAALGLAGIAVRSGARSTLASLWNVDDESSVLFLDRFYQSSQTQLAKAQLTKAEALQRAQLSLIQNPNYRHPFFWASYVLLGNWL